MVPAYFQAKIFRQGGNEHDAHRCAKDLQTDEPLNLARALVHGAKHSTSS